ncbi:hypothetical protein [Actinoplanes sp. NPDC049681]|uniref:hypothetical protein n=1 Tax=Actinoplanes sp. NPDC049681 TaxID=3363905 RepID=UPI0037A5EFF8
MGVIKRFLGKAEDRPAWLNILRGIAGTAVLLFVVFPLAIGLLAVGLVLSGRMTWDLVEIPWLIAIRLSPFVTYPVHDFLAAHAGGLPVSGDALWLAWRVLAIAILIAGFTGVLWARAARVVLVVTTAAMMGAGTPDLYGRVTLYLTAAWLAIEAFLLYRRSGRLRFAVRKRMSTRPPTFADDHLEVTVVPDPPAGR